jgi:hypothetical protein
MADSIEQGTFRDTEGGQEVWDGEKWLSPLEAVERLGNSFQDVGELVREEVMGGGAFGSPSEYSVVWRIWRVGDKYVLDMDEDGIGHIVCDGLADCEATWDSEAEVHYPEEDEEDPEEDDEEDDEDEDEDDEDEEDEEEDDDEEDDEQL